MSDKNLPNAEPGTDLTLDQLLQFALRKFAMQEINMQLPAKVVSYDRVRNVATVQPMIPVLTTSGDTVSRAPLAKLPVLALGGGGFVLNYPVKKGDLGWIEASDRDISLFMQAMSEARPNTVRHHRFSDARFIPDAFRAYTVAGEDANAVVLQTLSGATKIAVDASAVRIKTSGAVVIEGASTVTITAPTVTIVGATSISGGGAPISISSGGAPVNITGPVTIDGKPFLNHTHSIPTGQSGPVT